MKQSTVRIAAVVAVVVAILLGVAWFLGRDGASEGGEGKYADGDPAPATSRALVAVALSHVDAEPEYLEELWLDEDDPEGVLGADIRFEEDALLRVQVAPERSPDGVCTEGERCVVEETDAGTLRIGWDEAVPEEDPGLVAVTLEADGEFREARFSGPSINGDPREEEDLLVTVDDLVAIVTDPAFGLTSTDSAVAAGEKIEDWPGEPEVVTEGE